MKHEQVQIHKLLYLPNVDLQMTLHSIYNTTLLVSDYNKVLEIHDSIGLEISLLFNYNSLSARDVYSLY